MIPNPVLCQTEWTSPFDDGEQFLVSVTLILRAENARQSLRFLDMAIGQINRFSGHGVERQLRVKNSYGQLSSNRSQSYLKRKCPKQVTFQTFLSIRGQYVCTRMNARKNISKPRTPRPSIVNEETNQGVSFKDDDKNENSDVKEKPSLCCSLTSEISFLSSICECDTLICGGVILSMGGYQIIHVLSYITSMGWEILA